MRKEAVAMATQDSPSLYERLGGVYSIATVVDDLIDRVMADQRLNANPLVDDAHHKVPPAGLWWSGLGRPGSRGLLYLLALALGGRLAPVAHSVAGASLASLQRIYLFGQIPAALLCRAPTTVHA